MADKLYYHKYELHCSVLNYDLFMKNIIDNKYCVNGEVETPFHYMFLYKQYTLFRNQLHHMHEIGFVQWLSLDKILNGDNRFKSPKQHYSTPSCNNIHQINKTLPNDTLIR